jgi:hypothetical protein
MKMIAATALSLLLAGAARAARDPFADLKPLAGSWLIDKDCVVNREKTLAVFTKQPHSIHGELFDPARPNVRLGTVDITSNGVEDHYQLVVKVPDNPILKTLGIASIPGTLVISDDTGDPDSPGKDYLSFNLAVSVFNSQTTAKLRSHYKKATFIFKDETPMGKDQCRGTAVKQKAPAPAR